MAQLKSGTTIGGRNIVQELDVHLADKVAHTDYAVASGTNTYTANIQGITALVEGLSVKIKFTNANTGASTLNINELGAKEIRKSNGNTLSSGNIKAGQICHLVYTGSVFQLLGEGGEYGNATPNKVLKSVIFGTEEGLKEGSLAPKLCNRVYNGSFEYDFDGWGSYSSAEIKTDNTKFGNKCAYFNLTTSSAAFLHQAIRFKDGHKIYVCSWIKRVAGTGDVYVRVRPYDGDVSDTINGNNVTSSNYTLSSVIREAKNGGILLQHAIYTQGTAAYIDGVMAIDLTEAFGEGNEPDKATMDAIVKSGNILGEDGDCEDLTKWTIGAGASPSIFELDTTAKVFGGSSIKLQASGSTVYKGIAIKPLLEDKHYFLSGYIKSADGICGGHIAVRKSDTFYIGQTPWVFDTSFKRVGSKFIGTGQEIAVGLYVNQGTSTNGYCNVDGIMLMEITEEEYNSLSVEELLEKYPYTSRQAGWWDSDLTLLTSDANATAAQILSGNTAYVNGVKVTGTMPNQGAKIIMPSTVNQAIPAGFHNGLGYVQGSTNLKPENIKNGVNIFNVIGTLDVVGESVTKIVNHRYISTSITREDTPGEAEQVVYTLPNGCIYMNFIDYYCHDRDYKYFDQEIYTYIRAEGSTDPTDLSWAELGLRDENGNYVRLGRVSWYATEMSYDKRTLFMNFSITKFPGGHILDMIYVEDFDWELRRTTQLITSNFDLGNNCKIVMRVWNQQKGYAYVRISGYIDAYI